MTRPSRFLLLSLLALACTPSAASAGWFVGEPIDGPGPITEAGAIDIARDGTGALVYTRMDGGVPHVYLSRLFLGVWRAPERLDVGLEGPSGSPVVAVADEHRIMVAWVNAGRLFGAHVQGGTPGPLSGPVLLHDAPITDPVRDPHAAMSINGTGYVTFTAPGGGGADVRAVRLFESGWEAVPAPLDIGPGSPAGAGDGRPRVAVSAEGNAVVTFGEPPPGQPMRIYARRVTGLNVSLAPQEVSVATLDGRNAAGEADLPDIAIEDDGSYAWVVWRQAFDGGSRAVARRLVGSLFETPIGVDGLGPQGEGVAGPHIAMNGRGVGAAVVGRANSSSVGGAFLDNDAFGAGLTLSDSGSVAPPDPQVAVGENRDVLVVWRRDPGAGPTGVRARYRPRGKALDPEAELADPAYGPVVPGSLRLDTDRLGNAGAMFLQGGPGDRRLVVAVHDRVPSGLAGRSTTRWQPRSRPKFSWSRATEAWGPLDYELRLDGEPVVTQSDKVTYVPVEPIEDGVHRWQVVARDRRGQIVTSKLRTMRIDTSEPDAVLRITGTRKAGRSLRFRVRPDDAGGSGFRSLTVDYGDRTRKSGLLSSRHTYRKAGRYTIRIRTRDRAGNTGELRQTVRIKK